MHSRIRKRTYAAIYRLLDRVSPLDEDCGKLCGAVCCIPDFAGSDYSEEDLGLYLLPGEDKIHDRASEDFRWSEERTDEFEFPDSWDGRVYFIHCVNPPHCNRAQRPIQCRTFPLAPHITAGGELLMIYDDTDVPYRCPLIEREIPLNDRFVQATRTVWTHLIRDPLIYDLVRQDSEEREGSRIIRFLYPEDTSSAENRQDKI